MQSICAQPNQFERWRLALTSSSLADLAAINKLVSSANSLIFLQEMNYKLSFMYKRNKSGPKTDPWGTPQETGNLLELHPFTDTTK